MYLLLLGEGLSPCWAVKVACTMGLSTLKVIFPKQQSYLKQWQWMSKEAILLKETMERSPAVTSEVLFLILPISAAEVLCP